MNIHRFTAEHKASSQPKVPCSLYIQRLKRLIARSLLSEQSKEDALRLSNSEYRAKYNSRKSYIEVDGCEICLNVLYESNSNGTIKYCNFRNRIRTYANRLKKYGVKHDESIVVFAATFINREWARVIGSGKARPFQYTGNHFNAFTGRTFCSLYHFLIEVQLQLHFKLIRSRLKQKWPIDRALLEEKREANRKAGSVYCLTCNPSQKRYVGITCGSISSRFKEHVREASTNSTRLIASEIRQFGAESFDVEPLALNVPIDNLGELERGYIIKLNTLHPFGLNANRGGQLSYTAGKQIKIEDEIFESITNASETISARTGGEVPAYVIESRIRDGRVKLSELIKPSRRASKHSDAGKLLFRKFKGLLRRNEPDERWKNYELFKIDVLENISFKEVQAKRLVLAKKDSTQPYSKQNFEWVSKLEVIVKRCGKKCVVHGHTFASVEAVARCFAIPASSLRYEIKNSSESVEGAVSAILKRRTKIKSSK